MARIRDFKTNFTAGELDFSLIGRQEIEAYANGASKLRNVEIRAQGIVQRRRGLGYVDSVSVEPYQVMEFVFDSNEHYLMLFRAGAADIYDTFTDSFVGTLTGPWTAAMLDAIVVTQSGDRMVVCHPDLETQLITRTAVDTFGIEPFEWEHPDKRIFQPHHSFAAAGVTLKPSGTSGSITLTTNEDYWVSDHVGKRIRHKNKEIEITGFTSATVVDGDVKEDLVDSAETTDWTEQAFSSVRGWPRSALFHASRLWFGGSRELPDMLFATNISRFFRHDIGDGQDDDAIQKAMAEAQVATIRHLIAVGDLQVFTDTGEYFVRQDGERGYTPTTTAIQKQTRFGSSNIPPAVFDGATFFVPKQKASVREFLYDDLRQAYRSDPLSVLAPHFLRDPRDLAVQLEGEGQMEQYAFVVNKKDGSVATFLSMRQQGVAGWTLWTSPGASGDDTITNVGVVNSQVYFLVERTVDNTPVKWLERALPERPLDAFAEAEDTTAKSTWGPFAHLASETVDAVSRVEDSDGTLRWMYLGRFTLDASGNLDLGEIQVTHVIVGFDYPVTIETLPVVIQNRAGTGFGQPLKMVRALVHLENTANIVVDQNRLRLRQVNDDLSLAPKVVSGTREFWLRGVSRTGALKLVQDVPLPLAVSSIVVEVEHT